MSMAGEPFVGFLLLVHVLCWNVAKGVVAAEDGFYRAVVVEYSPRMDSSLDGRTNLMNNVHEYIKIMKDAKAKFMTNIIVFPEIGLQGYGNQRYPIKVPNPADRVVPCAHDTPYEAPIEELSCAARTFGLYLVVNVNEIASDSNVTYNTDVVFDPDGAIVARYRKINLFDESHQTPGQKELVFFDTNFGVRFGIFTCFDIIFQVPAVELARTLNITHFIFPTAWFSEMPFLTAVQQQWHWSYTLDVVLLGANYNLPSVGSTGSGIFIGRKGPAAYKMTEDRGTFTIYAKIPKNFRASGISVVNLEVETTDLIPASGQGHSSRAEAENKLMLKKDFMDVYKTEPITVPQDAPKQIVGSEVVVPFRIERTICNGSLCCNFSIEVTARFATAQPPPPRPDDFSTLHFRLAAFDGVRTYGQQATGGVQTCAILPCANGQLASCGLRADDQVAETARLDYLYQTRFDFNSITISGNFSNNNTFVGPNILLKGEGRNFGSLLTELTFVSAAGNNSDVTLKTVRPIEGLVTASLYARLFDRDGQPYTGADADKAGSSPAFDLLLNLGLSVAALILLKISLSRT